MKYKNYLFVFFRTVLPASLALFLALACHQFGVVYFRALVSMNIDLVMHLKADTANSPTMQNRRFFLSLHSLSACLPAVTMCDMSHCLVPVWHIKKASPVFCRGRMHFQGCPQKVGLSFLLLRDKYISTPETIIRRDHAGPCTAACSNSSTLD